MAIDSFDGDYRFLSNFWLVRITYMNLRFPSVEHAYQAAKCSDPIERQVFTDTALTPGQAKSLGKRVKIRRDWESSKLLVMKQLLELKFPPDRFNNLTMMLDGTNNHLLVEGNTWGDTFWGKCDGEGRNALGKLLMKVREQNRPKVRSATSSMAVPTWASGISKRPW